MARKPKGSGSPEPGDRSTGQQGAASASPAPATEPGPGCAETGGAAVAAIHKRLRALRMDLLQAEESGDKYEAGHRADGRSESAAAPKVAILRALVDELEELSRSAEQAGGCGAKGPGPAWECEAQDKQVDLGDEAGAHHQTLRLAYAATEGLDRAEAASVGDADRAALSAFYGMLIASVRVGELDEKMSLTRADVSQHLRLLAARSPAQVAGTKGAGTATYAGLADIVDRVVSGTGAAGAAVPLAGDAPRAVELPAVRMPKLTSMSVTPEGIDVEDSEFRAQIILPPGGITFFASADIVDGNDGGDGSDGAAKEESPTPAEKPQATTGAASADVAMPIPTHGDEVTESKTEAAPVERVGGFAHPLTGIDTGATASSGAALQVAADQASEAPVSMPEAATTAAASGATAVPQVGFSPYGVAAPGPAHAWAASTTGNEASMAAGVPGLPGAFGMMPVPYPPHIAMQCGYLPPHMYGMVGMGAAEAMAVSSLGAGPGTSQAALSQSARASPMGADPGAVAAAAQQSHGLANGMPAAVVPGTAPGEAWSAAGKNSSGGGSVHSESGGIKAVSHHQHAVHGLGNAPMPPMMMPMSSTDPYHHAMAAAAASGYSGGVPFMYPHIDASNLSTAATGGSENTDSVHSIDSASNRGGSSRPESVSIPLQQQQQQVPETSPRGFMPHAGPEYPPMAQYMWVQPDHTKHMQQGMYSYMYQQPPHMHHQPQPPHPQQYYPGGQGQSYRRRGSGGNSNNSSGTSGGSQQRERRGNSGYQRQQRWNNGGSQSYSRQPHSTGSASTAPAVAGGQVHHGQGGSSEQNSGGYGGGPAWQ